jgi:nucleotide-binding universal stress UspA family protein
VAAVVIGARGSPLTRHALGSTATAVATELAKPVLVVPPGTVEPGTIRRVLVPLAASTSAAPAPAAVIELARSASIDVVVLHVHDAESVPAFTDQPQHERRAWAAEFVARYCPWGVGTVTLETRVGRTAELVPAVAEECRCDAIALAWSRSLALGRAPVVRAALERSRVPVLLVPTIARLERRRHARLAVGSAA